MNFEEFTETIRTGLVQVFEMDDMDITVNKIVKNNGIMLTGINIRQAHTMVAPTIYINDFYREDVDKKEIDNIVLKIKRIYQGRCKENPVGEEVKNYLDFDWVSERIFYTLINHSMNEEMLQNVPYLPFYDLAIVFRCVFHIGQNGIASSVVSEDDMKRWGVDTKLLYQLAAKNTPRLFPPVMDKITRYLKVHANVPDSLLEDFPQDDDKLYVLSNSFGINGAAALLYEGLLADCADLVGEDIYVLPSSIHETIFAGVSIVDDPELLTEIVQEANDKVISQSDILSYNAYRYGRKTKRLTMIRSEQATVPV